jgi:hypothetical protein
VSRCSRMSHARIQSTARVNTPSKSTIFTIRYWGQQPPPSSPSLSHSLPSLHPSSTHSLTPSDRLRFAASWLDAPSLPQGQRRPRRGELQLLPLCPDRDHHGDLQETKDDHRNTAQGWAARCRRQRSPAQREEAQGQAGAVGRLKTYSSSNSITLPESPCPLRAVPLHSFQSRNCRHFTAESAQQPKIRP